MTRLPELERVLFDAAERIEPPVPAPRTRRWHRRSTLLLAVLASLGIAAGAVAAATTLLDDGAPVPPASHSPLPAPVDAAKGLVLASIRAPDPDGGPPWGIGTYDATSGTTTCVVVGRVQNGRLGVVGRDGVFGDDGRFHELTPAAQTSTVCGGRTTDGAFVSFRSMPPIPASGYTGPPGTAIGGCRERVNLDGPTVSPQTRRKLRGVPECSVASLRRVVAGFAGPSAASATLVAPGYRKTLTLDPKESGAYLFVVRSTSSEPPQLTITGRDGSACRPFTRKPC
jgi:hypothetical protein